MNCKHYETYPENVLLPDDVALEHFDQCFTPERRMEAWTWMRERSEVGTRCLMADHQGLFEHLRTCMTEIIRLRLELRHRPARSRVHTAYRARARRRTRRNR